jgi:hypothetical protein
VRHQPWRPLVVIELGEEEPALKFEHYLKTGSAGSSRDAISARRLAHAPRMGSAV